MPLTPPQIDPEHPSPNAEPPSNERPSQEPVREGVEAPADAAAGAPATKIYTARYGELDHHELLHLLDSFEDERARGRFRESIYISAFIYMALAWFVFYGPRVLWHAPRIKLASDVLHERMTTLSDPKLLPRAPVVRPSPPPRVDNHTLERLRAEERRPPAPVPPKPAPEASQPAETAAQPQPSTPPPPVAAAAPQPAAPVPNAPQPARRPPPVIAEAPAPQPSAKPSFNTGSVSDNMRNLARSVPPGSGVSGGTVAAPLRGGGSVGGGSEILSDTQGVDFSAWQRRFERGTMNAWVPLLPEEIQPPLSKKGETYLIITILPDGTIGDLKLEASSHDDAINRSCWGSIVTQGKLPQLPKEFHGPNIVIRVHYLVNMDRP